MTGRERTRRTSAIYRGSAHGANDVRRSSGDVERSSFAEVWREAGILRAAAGAFGPGGDRCFVAAAAAAPSWPVRYFDGAMSPTRFWDMTSQIPELSAPYVWSNSHGAWPNDEGAIRIRHCIVERAVPCVGTFPMYLATRKKSGQEREDQNRHGQRSPAAHRSGGISQHG
jgi:hypothetical protein